MSNLEMKQAALQQFKNRWNSSPAPKSKLAGLKFKFSSEIAFIPEMDDAQFEQLKKDIQEAVAQNTLAKLGKILLRKNPAIEKWEIWSGRGRYRALSELGIDPQPFLKFVGASKQSMLLMAIEENVKHRAFTDEELKAFLTLAEAAMEALAGK